VEMDAFLDSTGEMRKNDSLPVLVWSGNPCYTEINHRLRGFGEVVRKGDAGGAPKWPGEQSSRTR
jgi:hypothetical protein